MHPCPGNWVAIEHGVVFYARADRAFSAGIKCRHCIATLLISSCDISVSVRKMVIYSIEFIVGNCVSDSTVDEDWPKEGKVEFEDVSLRYDASLDPVINGMSVTIQPGEKVRAFTH